MLITLETVLDAAEKELKQLEGSITIHENKLHQMRQEVTSVRKNVEALRLAKQLVDAWRPEPTYDRT